MFKKWCTVIRIAQPSVLYKEMFNSLFITAKARIQFSSEEDAVEI